MTDLPAPTRRDHQKFCECEGWEPVRNARGKSGSHHVTYELSLPDGTILRTRISHPPDRSTYGSAMWNHILRDQVKVPEDDFWMCVLQGAPPDRGQAQQPQATIPAALVHQLVVKFHVPEDEVARMTKQEAVERLAALWSQSD